MGTEPLKALRGQQASNRGAKGLVIEALRGLEKHLSLKEARGGGSCSDTPSLLRRLGT